MKCSLVLAGLFVMMMFLQSSVFAGFETADCFKYYNFQNGLRFDDLHADKVTYAPQDKVYVSYVLNSGKMDAPIVEGRVRVQIFYVDDGEQKEQMVDEFFAFDDVHLMSDYTLPQEFKWVVPKGAKSGKYVVKTYFIVGDYANLAGLSLIPYGPPGVPGGMTDFYVENGGAVSVIWFDKQETYMNDVKYSFSASTPKYEPGISVTVRTKLHNTGDKSKQVALSMAVYKWDNTHGGPISEYVVMKPVLLRAGGVEDVEYSLPALDVGTYALLFVAEVGEEKSILKLRFSIKGAKGRFIYAGVESFPVVEGSENTVFFCLSNSADSEHSFRGHGTVEMVARDGAVILSEDFDSSVPVTPYGEAAVFVPIDSSFYFTLELKLYDENDTLHDEMILVYDYSKFHNINPVFDVKLGEDVLGYGDKQTYTVEFMDKDYGVPLNGELLVYVTDPDGVVVRKVKDQEIRGTFTDSLVFGEENPVGVYTITARELRHDLLAEKTFEVEGFGTSPKKAERREPRSGRLQSSGDGNLYFAAGVIVLLLICLAAYFGRRRG